MAKRGLQGNELAERMGVEPSAVSNWMRGENAAKGKNLRKLADVLECDPYWLSGDEEARPDTLREAYPQAEIRRKCHEYIDRILNLCKEDPDRMTWTYVELQRHFPIPREPAPVANPAYRPLNSISISEAEASAAAAEHALELERRVSRPLPGAVSTSAQKPAPSPGTSPESKGKK